MKSIYVKHCSECPFKNWDLEEVADPCNCPDGPAVVGEIFVPLPKQGIHEKCPLRDEKTIVISISEDVK